MKRLAIFLIVLMGLTGGSASAQDSLIFLPAGLHCAPFRSSIQEARVGIFKFSDASDMKVDIGNSIDIIGYLHPSDSTRITAGIDFMAFARTVGSEGLRLQIDAVDGFFGGNLTCSRPFGSTLLLARLRLLHRSAHLVDGHFSNGNWTDGKSPVPYTQDFGELVGAGILRRSFGLIRLYGGISYATLVRPAIIRRVAGLAGGEAAFEAGEVTGGTPVVPYIAWTTALTGTDSYEASHQIQAGVKLGEYFGKGPSLYIAWYDGQNMFGEYYDQRISTIGAGFTVDFN
jgi:hypothetical protein